MDSNIDAVHYFLKEEIEKYISASRYHHSLEVETECRHLAQYYALNEAQTKKLSVAAYLHDITKDHKLKEQLVFCDRFGLPYTPDDVKAPKTFHAKTGAALARQLYPDLVDDEVYGCIRYHTTGREDMTLMEKLVYLADYIEPSRTFSDCVELRKYFYCRAIEQESMEDKLKLLNDTLIVSFDMTLKNLMDNGERIILDTVKSRNYLI